MAIRHGAGLLLMLERLGQVVYWTCCIVAALFGVGGVAAGVAASWQGNYAAAVSMLGAFVIIAIVTWGIGRAARYVLTGR